MEFNTKALKELFFNHLKEQQPELSIEFLNRKVDSMATKYPKTISSIDIYEICSTMDNKKMFERKLVLLQNCEFVKEIAGNKEFWKFQANVDNSRFPVLFEKELFPEKPEFGNILVTAVFQMREDFYEETIYPKTIIAYVVEEIQITEAHDVTPVALQQEEQRSKVTPKEIVLREGLLSVQALLDLALLNGIKLSREDSKLLLATFNKDIQEYILKTIKDAKGK